MIELLIAGIIIVIILIVIIKLTSKMTQMILTIVLVVLIGLTILSLVKDIGKPEVECVQSLCDCGCYVSGLEPESSGLMCGINCLENSNVIGCEVKENGCVNITK